ncbi:MAG: hypothetical protein HQM11_13125 [SAR324 cluster bacterium]|nr:hypothetical protein [SAR324 cluster bacterium]
MKTEIWNKISKSLLCLLVIFSVLNNTAQAQERGPLMMNVELGFTLGGVVAGAGLGILVWVTDPLGPTPLLDAMEVGVVIGAVLGAGLGFYVLRQSLVYPPGEDPNVDFYNQLLGQRELYRSITPTNRYASSASRAFKMNLVNFKF